MAKYTAHQAYALGQWLIANQKDFPNYYLDSLGIRHLEYNAIRNLPEASETYFKKKFGQSIEQLMNMVTQFQAQKDKPKPVQTAVDAVAVRIIDLSAPTASPQDPRAAMFVNCCVCSKQIAVPAARANEPAYCNKQCLQAATQQAANDEHAMLVFMQSTPQFYPCAVNFQALGNELERLKKTNVTTTDIVEAYRNLNQQNRLLTRLTDADVRNMSSAELEARTKIDPQLGGAVLVQEGQRHLQGAFQVDQTNESRLRPFVAEGVSGRKGWV